MKKIFFFFIVFASLIATGQVEVNNPTPNVFLDSRKYLYLDAENPIIITNGKLKSVKVSMINGTIKKTDVPGKYLAIPDEDSFYSTIILEAKSYKEEFQFYYKELPYPKVFLAGLRNEDGVLMYFKSSPGVMAFIENFPIPVIFKVDSFHIKFSDSTSEKVHMNIGSIWDATTTQMIKESKRGTFVHIYDVYVTGPRRKYLLPDKISHYIR